MPQNNLEHTLKASLAFISKTDKNHFHAYLSPDLVTPQEI